jgi:tetratricopeptide (TPR) repeat protein
VRSDPALEDALDACRTQWLPGHSPAEAGFDALLDRWPHDPVALEAVAQAYDVAGDTEHAARCYRMALSGLQGAELRRCHLRLADAERRGGHLEEAIATLRHGLEEFPGSRSIRTFLAMALHEQGHADLALGLVLQVLVDPMPSPDLELFAPAVRERARRLVAPERVA